MIKIREPQVAGMFYPSDPNELRSVINEYMDSAEVKIKYKHIGGIITPHAGYAYSGKTAAYAFKTIQNTKYKKVIVLSPSHREYFQGVSVFSGDAYKTPLGEIPINREIREKIIDEKNIIFSGIEGHGAEHALEVQLPFLQVAIGDFELIPLVIGDQNKDLMHELGEILSHIIDDETLIVASSDLSHYYSKSHANVLDTRIVNRINEFNYDELQNDIDEKRCEACGGGGIVAALKALKMKNNTHSKVVAHSDSGSVTGDDTEVVGYLSAVIYN